ncbi:MAG: class I SAM-dependent methyltransferase [Patescibacteria group bacterium]|jgi:ubiquinone/menaquinone biosynthesis C-methylase UbiE
MDVKKIYEARFVNIEERKSIWKVLVNDFFQHFIKKNDVVLDVGCGYGEFINEIICGQKLAVDSNKAVKKYLNKGIRFFPESSTKMSHIKDRSVNKVFVSNFFEHLKKEDIVKTIKEFKRVLKSQGKVLVLQPNIRFCAKDYWMFFDHITALDDRVLEEVFAIQGFKLKKIILKFLPFTMKSVLPKLPIFVKLYLKLPFVWQIMGKQSFLIFEKL